MMAFEYNDNENKQYTRFTYPDDMNTIIRYIEERGKLNIDYMNLLYITITATNAARISIAVIRP